MRNTISISLQDPKFLNESLYKNLSYDQSIPEDKVWDILVKCELKSLVESWPDKIHTVIGKNGVKLSGGQRQRLSIARVY